MTKLTERLKNRGWKLKMGDISEIAQLEDDLKYQIEMTDHFRTKMWENINIAKKNYDALQLFKKENDEMRILLTWLRTTNMFHGPAIRTGFEGVVHPISDEVARWIDYHIAKGEE